MRLTTRGLNLYGLRENAPYADALADTVPTYTDEVAAIAEALADDHLVAASRSALRAALTRSQQAAAQMTAAFGGGE